MPTIKASDFIDKPRNYIINGNFDIWQRGQTFSTTGTYSADRWKFQFGASVTACTISRTTDSNYPTYMMSAATTTGTGSNGYITVGQQIEYEEFKSLLGKSVTISFIAAAKNTNIGSTAFHLVAHNHTSSKDINVLFGANSSALLFEQTFTLTTTPTLYSYTFTLPADSLSFCIAFGKWTQEAMTTGDGWDISRVWLNEGVPQSFQLAGINTEGELSACQRYFEKSYNLDVAPGSNSTLGCSYNHISTDGAGNGVVLTKFSVSKRILPVFKVWTSSGTADVWNAVSSAGGSATPTMTIYYSHSGVGSVVIYGQTGGGGYVSCYMSGQWTADAEF